MDISRCICRAALGIAGSLACFASSETAGQCLTNNVTNIVWRVDVRGSLAKQNYDQTVVPYIRQARFRTTDLLAFILGRAPTASELLAINLDLTTGTTNVYLSVFNTQNQANSVLVSLRSNQVTTIQIDCTNFSFAVEAVLPPQTGGWLGGRLQIAGSGKVGPNGFAPIRVRGGMNGVVVDRHPADLGGTTALVTRTTMRIRGEPLRVQPHVVP